MISTRSSVFIASAASIKVCNLVVMYFYEYRAWYIIQRHDSAILVGWSGPPLNNGYIQTHALTCPQNVGNAEPTNLCVII